MLARGRYGIEWNANPIDDESNGLGWVIAVALVVALAVIVWALLTRGGKDQQVELAEAAQAEEVVAMERAKQTSEAAAKPVVVEKPEPIVTKVGNRPPKVRMLLQKLEVAQKKRDMEMEAETIEQIRGLPGSPAADLDDNLARRLGAVNFRRMFDFKNRLWVKEVVVKMGQSASRIAYENGSTLASFAKLNGGKVDKIFEGKRMLVMDHPRFQLVIHRRLKYADVMLNGKFFKRYDVVSGPTAAEGAYETPDRIRPFWKTLGIDFKERDRNEIEMLLPMKSPVLISEM